MQAQGRQKRSSLPSMSMQGALVCSRQMRYLRCREEKSARAWDAAADPQGAGSPRFLGGPRGSAHRREGRTPPRPAGGGVGCATL